MAYAAVISLKCTFEHLATPFIPHIRECVCKELNLLINMLRRLNGSKYRSIDRSLINALDAEIRDAVWKLEDVVESYVLYHSPSPSQGLGNKGSLWIPDVDEKGVERETDSFLKSVKKLEEEYFRELDKQIPGEEDDDVLPIDDLGGMKSTIVDDAAASPIDDFDGMKSKTVWLLDQFENIRNELLDWEVGLRTVSLVGMAGIGKTHLARELYQHPTIAPLFDFTMWASVGPKDQTKNIFVDIVAQVKRKPRNLYMRESMSNLIELLQDSLNGRRYLIVLDDLWSTHAIDIFIRWLPDYGAGCRLLVITRDEKVAKRHSTGIHQTPFHRRTIHHVRFLNNEESWILLWQNVFADKYYPQLEKAGRKIAEKCEGLPLLILTVADILCRMEKTEECWEKVADEKTTTFTDAYDRILKVLYLSYEYLPQHLKACFLYMGVLPQRSEIPLPKLINLWAVEDFREPWVRDFEHYAMECMRELVSKSLAIVCKESSFNRIKSSKLHSAYWHLCVKEARKNKFFHVLKNYSDGSKVYIESQRRLSVQNNILFGIKEVYNSIAASSTTRSLLCTGKDHEYPVPICFNLVLLKVLDALSIRLYEFPVEVVKLLQLRYLGLTHNGKVPSSISKLQQLQYLTVRQHYNIKLLRDSTCLPKEIWRMQQLRYLHIMGNLPEPDPWEAARLPNLFMLNVNAHSCTKKVFNSTPYLRKLGVKIELHPDASQSISYLEHVKVLEILESLKCVVVNPQLRSRAVAPPHELFTLPQTLKKLSLNGMGYSWEYISAIGSLPNLQVLKLRCSAFQGPEWKTMSTGFSNLEHLLLEDVDLVHWTAEDNCFKCLQRLIIRHCYKLKEIPPQIGVISSLKKLEVVDCSPSVVASAHKINYRQVVIKSSWNLRR